MGSSTYSIQDVSGETTRTQVRWVDLDAANYAAQIVLLGDVRTAINGVTLADVNKMRVVSEEQIFTPGAPPAGAHREVKWLVRGTDTVLGFPVSLEIGTADFNLVVPGTDKIDLTSAAWLALKAALDAGWRSRAGNLVVADDALFVGRNV